MLCTLIGAIILSINIQVGLNMRLCDDIGDASSSLRGSTSSFVFKLLAENQKKKIIIKKNSEVWILIKLQCVICQWIRLNELYKVKRDFLKFQISFWNCGRKPKLLSRNRKLFKRVVWRESKCNVLYINRFVSTCSTNYWKVFVKF